MPLYTPQTIEKILLIASLLLPQAMDDESVSTQLLGTNISMLLPSMIMVLLCIHQSRYELMPLYVGLMSQVILTVLNEDNLILNWVCFIFQYAGPIASCIICTLFPIPSFTPLPGHFQTIGCQSMRLDGIDCRIFYPSSISVPGRNAIFTPFVANNADHFIQGLSIYLNIPRWLLGYNFWCLKLLAVTDAPLSTINDKGVTQSTNWPLVIFSHGLAGSLELYSSVNQQVASEGNIVVAVNHNDGSACWMKQDDGTIKYYQSPPLKDNLSSNNPEGIFRTKQLKERVNEIQRVLSTIQMEANKGHQLFKNIDFNNINMTGHSFGAATALTVVRHDNRFKRAVCLDAWMAYVDKSDQKGLGSTLPILHLISDQFLVWQSNFQGIKLHADGCTHEKSGFYGLSETRHTDFSDTSMFISPTVARYVNATGKADLKRTHRIIGQLVSAFLRDTLSTSVEQIHELRHL